MAPSADHTGHWPWPSSPGFSCSASPPCLPARLSVAGHPFFECPSCSCPLCSSPGHHPSLPSMSIEHQGPQGMAVLWSRAGDKADNSMGSEGQGSPRAGDEEEGARSTWLGQGGAQGGALEKAVLCCEGLKAEAASVSSQESPGQSFWQKGHHTEIRCIRMDKNPVRAPTSPSVRRGKPQASGASCCGQ